MSSVFYIKIKPGSFKDEITIDAEGNWIIKIKEKPIDGAANTYLIKFLSKEFKLSKSEIIIEKGLSSRIKKIRLNLTEQVLEELLDKYKK